MDLYDVPGRVFLDTSVVNFILEFGEQIHDGADKPRWVSKYQSEDIDALYNIFLAGRRADWQLAISPFTYYEIAHTVDQKKNSQLSSWFIEIWNHWINIIESNNDLLTLVEAEKLRTTMLTSNVLDDLPDIHDRVLIIDALVYRCDCFCTRDWNTILNRRDKLTGIGIPILTPFELWDRIRPFAHLWV